MRQIIPFQLKKPVNLFTNFRFFLPPSWLRMAALKHIKGHCLEKKILVHVVDFTDLAQALLCTSSNILHC